MGVKYAWPLLRKKGLVPDSQDKVSLVSNDSNIRVGVCSTHNTPTRYYQSNPTDMDAAHGKLEQWLLKIGDKDKMRFYIDGLPAAEKKQTHANRHQSRQKALIKAAAAVSNLQLRLAEKRRIRKPHITDADKHLLQAFHWSLEHRMLFVEYMANKGYDIVLSRTESDVFIAAECQPNDAVISGDSDLSFYKTVRVVWRLVGSYRLRRFVPFQKNAVLEALDLSSTQLTALAIVSGDDYVANIPYLAVDTNRKILNTMHGDEKSIILQYLAHPRIKRRTDQEGDEWSEESYTNAVKVFVRMQQSIASDSSEDSARDTPLSYTSLREPRNKMVSPFATVDKQNAANARQHRPRFSPKVRFEPSKEQPASAASMQYVLKPWKKPLEEPSLPEPTKKKPVAAIKINIGEDHRFGCKEMMNSLCFQHPTVALDLDRLPSNACTAVENDLIAKSIVECIRGAVRVAWDSKRQCQMLIGLYLEDIFYPPPTPGASRPAVPVANISLQDQVILDNLYPRLSSKKMGSDNYDVSSAEDGQDDGSNAPFFRSFLTFLY
ncbi:hypothetical protein EDD11_009077 [Mortierella claussenii]|nr:hypothetical protein EDD11_009077 [Mortierella claussenii]